MSAWSCIKTYGVYITHAMFQKHLNTPSATSFHYKEVHKDYFSKVEVHLSLHFIHKINIKLSFTQTKAYRIKKYEQIKMMYQHKETIHCTKNQ